MSKMSDATAKEEVLVQLSFAEKHISAALLYPRGMPMADFHDLTNMRILLQEMQEDIKRGVQ